MMEYQRPGFQPAGYQAQQRKPYLSGHYPVYPQQTQPLSHSRSRTTSSNILPAVNSYSNMNQPSPTYSPYNDSTRRLSTATSSTSSTGGQITRSGTNNSTGVRRSTSGKSSASPTSYVALMRKQKATVWCDRSQHEDPRIAAAQRMAKERAAREIQGVAGRSSTLGSAQYSGKIRHSGRQAGYLPANMTGAGVPVRLSANEIGENEDDQDDAASGGLHNRTGSGRSSLNSNRYPSAYIPRPQTGRFSSGSTPPVDMDGAYLSDETPVGGAQASRTDYFEKQAPSAHGSSAGTDTPEREDSFGDIKELAAPNAILKAAENAKKAEELRRRGSVDERTMTLNTQRLFVANPDLDDD